MLNQKKIYVNSLSSLNISNHIANKVLINLGLFGLEKCKAHPWKKNTKEIKMMRRKSETLAFMGLFDWWAYFSLARI